MIVICKHGLPDCGTPCAVTRKAPHVPQQRVVAFEDGLPRDDGDAAGGGHAQFVQPHEMPAAPAWHADDVSVSHTGSKGTAQSAKGC
jgi:hypothetical protein